jgi:hypothetical protein
MGGSQYMKMWYDEQKKRPCSEFVPIDNILLPLSPFNRKQTIKDFDLHNRHLLDEKTEPNPKLIVDYKVCKIALYEHTVAMFSFFTKTLLKQGLGYMCEDFKNCWEHVSSTNYIIKAGYHPPFWWFADLADSHELIEEAPGAIENSSIAKDKSEWMKDVMAVERSIKINMDIIQINLLNIHRSK